jgi:hypothetical protein
MLGLTICAMVLMDACVALSLAAMDYSGRFDAIVRYFDYGRSVPGKLARWEADPERPGNLYDVAWRPEIVAQSGALFASEPPDAGPVVRCYGMSFTNNILRKAAEVESRLALDLHSGPGAPPNFTFGLFEDDRANRRAGDVAILGVLSSSVPMMAALSNRTWVFEQPAPFTYPIYRLDGPGLRRVDPLVNSAAAQRALAEDPESRRAWSRQMAAEDAFYSAVAFRMQFLDSSPFVRLVRRAHAIDHVNRVKREIMNGAYPYADVLQRMIARFARIAREDGQIPLVMLIQSRDPADPDILELAKPVLEREQIPYFATAEHFDPRDLSGFIGDGHYREEVDRKFGAVIAELIPDLIEQHRSASVSAQ